ncbi:MAG: ribulose-phosphate 3-epimerase [Patescibacteria group bacterium]|jgi:ribulose-phosphate 3-epimerase
MPQVIPAILARTEEEFIAKIEKIRPLGVMVQIDVMDGRFVPNTTWADPEKIPGLLKGIPFEAHLMVDNPEHMAIVWLAAGAARVFFHIEATEREELILRSADKESGKVGIAINPDTPLSRITPMLDKIKNVLIMGVNPGASGQTMLPITLDKIEALKVIRPALNISIDGGVNLETAPKLIRAGADCLVAANALTNSPDPAAALAELKRIVQENQKL